jgi:hypothetical protein
MYGNAFLNGMENKMPYLNIKVTSQDDNDLNTFAQFLKTAEHCCRIGASRRLVLVVDGDGSASLHFDFGKTNVSELTPRDVDGALEFYIGE